jgi:hypothetical protein
LKIDNKIYNLYSAVFKEFTVQVFDQDDSKIELEIKLDRFNYLILIITVVLNYEIRNDPESVLQSLIERFFRRLDRSEARQRRLRAGSSESDLLSDECEEQNGDASSQYSTLSSLIGIQVSLEKKTK